MVEIVQETLQEDMNPQEWIAAIAGYVEVFSDMTKENFDIEQISSLFRLVKNQPDPSVFVEIEYDQIQKLKKAIQTIIEHLNRLMHCDINDIPGKSLRERFADIISNLKDLNRITSEYGLVSLTRDKIS